MICPHCEYTHGYGWVEISDKKGRTRDDYVLTDGGLGDFYELEVSFKRREGDYRFNDYDTKPFYACPKCRKTFIGE